MRKQWVLVVPWVIFGIYLLLQIPMFLGQAQQGSVPIDFLTYQRAAEALERGESPYGTPQQSQAIWRYFHRNEVELLAAHQRGEGALFLKELVARPQQPGPYQYLPTLALGIAQLKVHFLVFAGLTILSILGFAWLWLRSTQASPWWLLLIVGSHDVLASLQGGNVELLLLFLTLLAARCLWDQRWCVAIPLIVLVLLIKPFYGLFFITLLLFQQQRSTAEARLNPRSLAIAVAVMVALIALEVYRWGAPLRADTWRFLLNASDYSVFALPVAEQTPMSAWNRTPLQALVSANLPLTVAQIAAFALWLSFLGVAVWRSRQRPLTFPIAFALALVLLYWGRPIGWGFIYLELVVTVVVWPVLRGWQKPAVLAVTLGVMASRWWALILTLQGQGMHLLTLQSATFPWETGLVLPLSGLLLLYALARSPTTPRTKAETKAPP